MDIGRVNGPVQGLYRVHGQNMHLTTFAGMARDLRERALVFDLLFAEDHPLPPDASDLHRRARRALAGTAIRLAMQDGVDADPHGSVEAFEEFACESWPGITETHLWRRHQATRMSGTTAAVRFQRKVAPISPGDGGGGTACDRVRWVAERVRRGIVWSLLNNLTLRLDTFLVGVAIARILAPQDFGVYAIAIIVQTILMKLASCGRRPGPAR